MRRSFFSQILSVAWDVEGAKPMHGARVRRASLATCLWPGLFQLWVEGAWSGLALAFGFGCLLNLLLLNSLVWTEWAEASQRTAAWVALSVFWFVSAGMSWRWRAEQNAPDDGNSAQDLFPQALGEYLRGNWYEAESLCRRLLCEKARDVEAQLMLATILRHTGRRAEARERLDDLKRMDDAAQWEWEIANELERLAEAEDHGAAESEPQAAQTPTPMLEAA
jgi:hypothetical protein